MNDFVFNDIAYVIYAKIPKPDVWCKIKLNLQNASKFSHCPFGNKMRSPILTIKGTGSKMKPISPAKRGEVRRCRI